MKTSPTSEPTGSPAISEPIRFRVDTAAPDPTQSPHGRNPARRLLSALRGDKHMVGAYPPGEER